ncbi:MAG: Abi family protein [Candidatus Accumulibacter sp.]|uniref:Abi family protein n=1 Tax=Accumulibacter sp. TaxID=2053492 RepID=UPI0025E0E1A6|nr:Abi family protein [Accumulibacter sp.]MCM8597368.1 Abi family protein [Accumulibacter sp.]MCM8664376.1 Abi family protein [Accumulibacter sp.]
MVCLGIDLGTSPLYTPPNNTRHASACKRTPAGFLLPMKFTKPATDLDAQLALLRSRGMVISDEARAKHYLRFIGYYRLSGYSLPFQINYNADGSHRFLDGVGFDDVLDLYVFDRKLRLAVMDALERIEVAFRAVLSQSMSERHGAHWYMDATLFVPKYRHDKFLDVLKKDIGDDPAKALVRQTFIQHYYDKYSDPALPPSWMVFEVLSFGTVSQVFKNLLRDHQKPIGKTFGLDGSVLASWLHAITYLRNLAAHHQRLWNRAYTIKPIVANQYAAELADPIRFYAQAVMIEVLLKVVSPDTHWGERLAALLTEHPKVRADRLGFPADWQQRNLWRRT